MKFYYHPFSPPSRNVWMILEALGIKYEEKKLDLFKGEHKTEEYKAKNPRQKVPTLDDDGFYVSESRACAMYLINQYGTDTKLYPSEPKARAKVDQQLFVDENLVSLIVSYVNPGGIIFRGENHNFDKIEDVKAALEFYESKLSQTKFVVHDFLTIADFFALTAIKLLWIADYDDFKDYPNICRWLKEMESLPYYEKTCKIPLDAQKEFIKSKIGCANKK